MKATTFALIAGALYLALGLLGLVPATLVPPPRDAPPTAFASLYGYLLGLFPVNVLHSALHIGVGFWGLCAWRRKCSAVAFARALAALFAALALLGTLPGANTLFGMMPIHGNDVWLHGATALAAFYFGWRARATPRERRRNVPDRRRHDVPVARERRLGLSDRRESFV
ncbi:MAG TPA: DUF4383 domain-containing protein [Burkholderiales bacterium]